MCVCRAPDSPPFSVGAAEGCDLFIFNVKRSQPSAAPTEGVYAHEIAGCFAQLCQLLRQQDGAYSQRSPKWVTGFGDLERSQ